MNLESHVAELERDGYTVIPDALSPQEVRVTRQAVKDLLAEEREVALGTGTQSANLLTSHTIVGKHPVFYEFFLNPPTMQVVRRMIGDDALIYDGNIRIPMPTGAANKRQGFQLHVDREDYTVVPFAGGKHFPMAMNVTWCLVDFTIGNGATLLWPARTTPVKCPNRRAGRRAISMPRRPPVLPSSGMPPSGTPAASTAATARATPCWPTTFARGCEARPTACALFPPEVRPILSEEAKHLLGFRPAPPDYSDVKALSSEQLAALSVEEKKVLGFAVY